MTKIRYTVDESGELVDRDGRSLGRVVSMTLDAPAEGRGGAMGGSEVPSQEHRSSKEESPTRDGGAGETSNDAKEVWASWCRKRQPKRTDLEPSQAKLIRKGLNAGFTVLDLELAIDGLLASDWHRTNRKLQLSTILATRPGGPTLRDQIDGWIERAPSSPSSGGVTSQTDVRAGRVNDLKAAVMRGWHRDLSRPGPSRDAIERREQAIAELREFGIDVHVGVNGKPSFVA